jgi:RNA polymerase sigma factor (sigma-70 family)
MATGQPRDILRQLRRAALLRDGGGLTDGQLLECFVTRQDEAAFEALVRRHGPMVLGVCRRLLRNPQDAEDAFQATFLVLVRKAAAIGRRELLGNWLYGVAYRTALDARAAATRRRARERQVSPMPEPEADGGADVWRDLRPLLDQELNRLPDKYRVPVVLCDLEGRTRRDVARQLGIPAGTLSGRLTTARRMLARRLSRHGLALSAGAFTAALSQGAASARVPSPLVAATVQAATAGAVGPVAAGVVSAKVAALAEGVLKPMFVTKLKVATAVLVAAGVVVGAALLAHPPGAAQPPAESAGKRPEPARAARAAEAPKVLKLGLGQRGRRVAWSPDGKTLAVVTKVEKTFLGFQYDRKGSAVKLWDVDRGQVRQTLTESTGGGLAFQQVVFSADGKAVAATVSESVRGDVVKVWETRALALKRTLGGGDSQLVCVAFSPDGKLIAAGDPGKKTVKLWNAGTGVLERTLRTGEAQPWSVAFAPGGKVLAVGGQNADHSGQVQLWDARAGTLKHVLKQDNYVTAVAFSPDGKMVAGSAGGELVQVWGVEKGEVIVSLKGHQRGQRTVAFSPDGKIVAVGGPDGKVRLWDVQTGKLKETMEGHEAEVYSIAFSPDGKTLASASQDQTVRLWPIHKPAAGPR